MSAPSSWRRNGTLTADQVEASLNALSRTRALTMDESLRLEWAIKAQIDDSRRQAGKYIPLGGPRKALIERLRDEEIDLAERIQAELDTPSLLKEME
ncbi:MAG: hypothetical protein V4527_18170 [Pseudomonadota bacterium]